MGNAIGLSGRHQYVDVIRHQDIGVYCCVLRLLSNYASSANNPLRRKNNARATFVTCVWLIVTDHSEYTSKFCVLTLVS